MIIKYLQLSWIIQITSSSMVQIYIGIHHLHILRLFLWYLDDLAYYKCSIGVLKNSIQYNNNEFKWVFYYIETLKQIILHPK